MELIINIQLTSALFIALMIAIIKVDSEVHEVTNFWAQVIIVVTAISSVFFFVTTLIRIWN